MHPFILCCLILACACVTACSDGNAVNGDPPQPAPDTGATPTNSDLTQSGGTINNDMIDRPDVVIDQSDPVTFAGIVSRSSGVLPGGLHSACEIQGHDRFTGDANPDAVPMRIYTATCGTNTETPRMFVSMTAVDDNPRDHHGFNGAPPEDTRVGVIFETAYDPDTGSLVRTGNDVVLDACDEAHGLVVTEDCQRIAVLCQRYDHASTTSSFTSDLLATFEGNARWLTQPNNVEAVDSNDNLTDEQKANRYRHNGEMWLLEWQRGNLQDTYDAYVVHKGISGSHLGNNTLTLGNVNRDDYALSVFAAVFDGGGGRHSGDTMLVIERDAMIEGGSGFKISDEWSSEWQCATGHTLHNRIVYHPDFGERGTFLSICTSDWTRDEVRGAGFWAKTEGSSNLFPGRQWWTTWGYQSRAWGGTHAFIPVANGLLGTVIGHPSAGMFEDEFGDRVTEGTPPENFQNIPMQLGLVSLGTDDGEMDLRRLRSIDWIVSHEQYSIGHPQLAALGDGSYLLGYAHLRDHLSDARGDLDYQVPWRHFIQHIDGAGNALGDAIEVPGIGWGEQDQWISLGQGRVAWLYHANPELTDRRVDQPPCSHAELQLSVYHQP